MDGSGDAVADIVRIGAVCIGAWGLVDVWVIRLFHVKHKFSEKIVKYKPKSIRKFFGAAVFQNCWIKKLFFRLRLVIYSQSSKKAAASSQEVAAFLQNILKIKGIIAKLFYTFYSLNFIIFLFSVAYINCFYSIRCVFNTSKIIDYWLLSDNCL